VSIWGHEHVKIEKDGAKKCWYVRTLKGALLCTIPWKDAYKDIKGATDYAAAIATCMGNAKTTLTPAEERELFAEIAVSGSDTGEASNVVAVDFKKKRRL
jgi:hypothetical protein